MPEPKNTKTLEATETLRKMIVEATLTPGAAPAILTLGAVCTVRVAKGIDLMNNETGVLFMPDTDTPVTCTITLLRRLQDGDLTLVA